VLLWVPEGTDAQYLSGLPDTVEIGILPQNDRNLSPDAGRVEFLIVSWFRDPLLFSDQLKQLTSLKVMQTYAAGVDRLIKFVPPGVILCNGKGLHDTAVSEWIVGAILAAFNKFSEFYALQDQGKWQPVDTDTLEGRTVTIFGYGAIGKAVEKRLSGFEVTVLRVARTERTEADGKLVHSFNDLANVLPITDVLVNILPLTAETGKIINADILSQLPENAIVINAGRGGTVDTDALIKELSSGRLRAVLDTTDPEPIPDGHKLWTTPNVFLTQHSSGNSSDYLDKVYPFIHEQIRRYMAGEPLLNIVNGAY
jgi:phosphoglycerate dehydrogenase-like enzyme